MYIHFMDNHASTQGQTMEVTIILASSHRLMSTKDFGSTEEEIIVASSSQNLHEYRHHLH